MTTKLLAVRIAVCFCYRFGWRRYRCCCSCGVLRTKDRKRQRLKTNKREVEWMDRWRYGKERYKTHKSKSWNFIWCRTRTKMTTNLPVCVCRAACILHTAVWDLAIACSQYIYYTLNKMVTRHTLNSNASNVCWNFFLLLLSLSFYAVYGVTVTTS